MYVLDSCVCIDFLRGRLPYALQVMKGSDPCLFKIPTIVEAELLLGCAKSNNHEKNRLLTKRFLAPFETIPFDSPAASAYAQIRADLEKKGTPIGPNDLIIAATALSRGAVLVTNNVSEIQRVAGLQIEAWAEVHLESEFVPL